jgi:tetratricopeptide (TPR) repeat protein
MILPASRLIALVVALFINFSVTLPALAQADELQEVNQFFKQGQLDRALDRVNAYLATRPKDARGRFLKGLILTEQNKPNDAIKVFTDLSQDFPELPEPYNNLAVLYASQGQYDKARSALEMAIRTHPSYATAHENLGDIYAKMASQAYDKALQLDKSNTTAQTKLNTIKELFPTGRPTPRPSTKGEPPAKVATAPAVVKPAVAQNSDEVLNAVTGWAKAWSENDVEGYLAHYSADFQTPKGENRRSWEAQRKTRVAKPRKIDVAVESPKVTFNEANCATVTFRQRYQSGSLKVSSTKTLVMVKAGDKWLIEQERTGG